MKTIITYKAWDGQFFNSAEECERHEEILHDEYVERFDNNFSPISLSDVLCSFLICRCEADTWIFRGHEGWKNEAECALAIESWNIREEEIKNGKRYLLLKDDLNCVTVQSIESIKSWLLEEVGFIENL